LIESRLEIETKAEKEKVLYNFYKKINQALQENNPMEISLIVGAFHVYVNTTKTYNLDKS
jgi:hypothetical protein